MSEKPAIFTLFISQHFSEMNKTIQIFENSEFGAIRTMSNEQGEPFFCAKDVAVALGYGNCRDAVRRHVGDGDVAKHDTLTNRGIQPMLYVRDSHLIPSI